MSSGAQPDFPRGRKTKTGLMASGASKPGGKHPGDKHPGGWRIKTGRKPQVKQLVNSQWERIHPSRQTKRERNARFVRSQPANLRGQVKNACSGTKILQVARFQGHIRLRNPKSMDYEDQKRRHPEIRRPANAMHTKIPAQSSFTGGKRMHPIAESTPKPQKYNAKRRGITRRSPEREDQGDKDLEIKQKTRHPK